MSDMLQEVPLAADTLQTLKYTLHSSATLKLFLSERIKSWQSVSKLSLIYMYLQNQP